MTDDTSAPGRGQTGDEDMGAYLEQVRREIDEEVRRRRAAGDFPPSFERKLDELFARFTPTGTSDDHFTEALKLADRSAYFDIDVPTGPRKQPKGFVKWSLWQAEAWFVRYVVTQLNHFAGSSMRVLHLLDERLSDIERQMDVLNPPPLPEDEMLARGADPLLFADLIMKRLRSQESPGERILHAECGDGSFLKVLLEGGMDAYAIDPGTAEFDLAVKEGLDVRRDDVLGHLASVGDEKLAGLVLSGCVDRMSLSERRRLIRLAELKLAGGGTLAIVGTRPESWQSQAGVVVSDLAAGRPLHPQTWVYLLSELGFSDVSVEDAVSETSFLVLAQKRAREVRTPATGEFSER